jgi:hypothetical protein
MPDRTRSAIMANMAFGRRRGVDALLMQVQMEALDEQKRAPGHFAVC